MALELAVLYEILLTLLHVIGGDKNRSRQFGTESHNAVGEAIRRESLKEDYTPIRSMFPISPSWSRDLTPIGTPLLEKLFDSVRCSDLAALQDATRRLQAEYPSFPIPWQALTTLAASKGSGKVFCFCLENDAAVDDQYTNWALHKASKDSDMLDTLFDTDWKGMRTSSEARDKLARSALFHDSTEMNWFLHHGEFCRA